MALRRPLVVVGGVIRELPSGDTLPGGGSGTTQITRAALDAAVASSALTTGGSYLITDEGVSITASGASTYVVNVSGVGTRRIFVQPTAPASPLVNDIWIATS